MTIQTQWTVPAIKRLLRDIHRLAARRSKGDEEAIVALLDLDTALVQARLTERQQAALYCVYWRDMRQVDAAAELGVTQHTVSALVNSACKRLAKVYAEWTKGEIE